MASKSWVFPLRCIDLCHCRVQVQQKNEHYRKRMSEQLRADMNSPCSDEIVAAKLIGLFVDLVEEASHCGHSMGEVSASLFIQWYCVTHVRMFARWTTVWVCWTMQFYYGGGGGVTRRANRIHSVYVYTWCAKNLSP